MRWIDYGLSVLDPRPRRASGSRPTRSPTSPPLCHALAAEGAAGRVPGRRPVLRDRLAVRAGRGRRRCSSSGPGERAAPARGAAAAGRAGHPGGHHLRGADHGRAVAGTGRLRGALQPLLPGHQRRDRPVHAAGAGGHPPARRRAGGAHVGRDADPARARPRVHDGRPGRRARARGVPAHRAHAGRPRLAGRRPLPGAARVRRVVRGPRRAGRPGSPAAVRRPARGRRRQPPRRRGPARRDRPRDDSRVRAPVRPLTVGDARRSPCPAGGCGPTTAAPTRRAG